MASHRWRVSASRPTAQSASSSQDPPAREVGAVSLLSARETAATQAGRRAAALVLGHSGWRIVQQRTPAQLERFLEACQRHERRGQNGGPFRHWASRTDHDLAQWQTSQPGIQCAELQPGKDLCAHNYAICTPAQSSAIENPSEPIWQWTRIHEITIFARPLNPPSQLKPAGNVSLDDCNWPGVFGPRELRCP
jgi:hypothetical protein